MNTLEKKHVLLVGYGAIGKWCAKLLGPHGCSFSGIQRKNESGIDTETGVQYTSFANAKSEFSKADHVVLILPGTPENRHVITRELLAAMKPDAYLYNIGRGNVVAEEDLVWALDNKIIGGAGLDVFEEEPLQSTSKLWSYDNVLLLPHTSAAYIEYAHLYVEQLIQQLQQLGY